MSIDSHVYMRVYTFLFPSESIIDEKRRAKFYVLGGSKAPKYSFRKPNEPCVTSQQKIG